MYSRRLKYLREEKELKQVEISKLLKFKDNVYSQFEREETIIPIKHLNALCNYFDCSLDYIFEFTDTKKYKNMEKEINKEISGERLRNIRKEFKIKQYKLAKLLNVDNSMLSKYELGKYTIATTYLYQICKTYNISADYLLGNYILTSFMGVLVI